MIIPGLLWHTLWLERARGLVLVSSLRANPRSVESSALPYTLPQFFRSAPHRHEWTHPTSCPCLHASKCVRHLPFLFLNIQRKAWADSFHLSSYSVLAWNCSTYQCFFFFFGMELCLFIENVFHPSHFEMHSCWINHCNSSHMIVHITSENSLFQALSHPAARSGVSKMSLISWAITWSYYFVHPGRLTHRNNEKFTDTGKSIYHGQELYIILL